MKQPQHLTTLDSSGWLPVLPVVEQCSVRTYATGYKWLSWLDLFCTGERGMANVAW